MNKKTDIIIFGGQSNMQGQTECLSESEQVKDAVEYRFLTDSFVPLKNPTGEDITFEFKHGYAFEKTTVQDEWLGCHVSGSACYGHTNLVPQFCRAYISKSSNRVVAVHIAKGSTVIADWLPGTDGYDILKQKSLAAINKAQNEFDVGKVYFVWLQGESDAICSNSRQYYKDKLKILADNLIRDTGIEKFAIIRVGRFNGDARDDEIIGAQTEICREDKNFVLLTDMISESDDQCGFFNPYVKGHLSAKGCETVGQAAGEALALERLNAGKT